MLRKMRLSFSAHSGWYSVAAGALYWPPLSLNWALVLQGLRWRLV